MIPHAPQGRRRQAASFIEIVIAMAILSGALIPIGWMLTGTASQTAKTKAEAAAASYAATLMNTLLDQVDFDDPVLAATGGTPRVGDTSWTHPEVPGETTIDGTRIQWVLEVHDFLASDPAIAPAHWRVRFNAIDDCPPAGGGAPVALPVATPVLDTHYNEVNNRTIADLDSKVGPPNTAVLKEIKLTIQWQTPRDAGYETLAGADTRTLQRSVVLMTRRARLARN